MGKRKNLYTESVIKVPKFEPINDPIFFVFNSTFNIYPVFEDFGNKTTLQPGNSVQKTSRGNEDLDCQCYKKDI